jgi:hypothetical protein
VRPYGKLLDWLRYLCAFLLYMYGMSKLAHMQFHLPSEIAHRPVGSLSGYELTWFYYGYSRTYACILGLTQVLGATLLLFRKTALAGALAMMPVIANILLINLFILVNDYGPAFMGTIIFISLLLIIWPERRSLISLVWTTQPTEASESRAFHHWVRALIVVAVLAIILMGVYHSNAMRGE